MRVWLKANFISLLARLGLAKFVVLELSADKSQESMDRHWRMMTVNAALVYVVMLALFISAFFIHDK